MSLSLFCCRQACHGVTMHGITPGRKLQATKRHLPPPGSQAHENQHQSSTDGRSYHCSSLQQQTGNVGQPPSLSAGERQQQPKCRCPALSASAHPQRSTSTSGGRQSHVRPSPCPGSRILGREPRESRKINGEQACSPSPTHVR